MFCNNLTTPQIYHATRCERVSKRSQKVNSSRSNRTRSCGRTMGNNYQTLQKILSAARRAEVWVCCATQAPPCTSSWAFGSESLRSRCSELPLWLRGKPRLDSSSERERSRWADDTVYWNSSDFCAPVFCRCFLRQNWIPSFCHESLILFRDVKPAPSRNRINKNACRNKITCYCSGKSVGLPRGCCSFTPSYVF